jgi:RND family efflux transporter MFP subunit
MKYFILSIVFVSLLTACSSGNENEKPAAKKASITPQYTYATVEKAGVGTIIKLPAQIAAFEEVSIFPKVNGYVKNVLVDIGTKVSKGNLLMVLEAPELEQASLQARERYTRARADLSLDKEHYQRLQEAAKTAGAISPLDISTAKTKMDADSALVGAEKANWQMQQSMQDYLQVRAPFDGVITERNVHPGALVSSAVKDKPMLELKQVKHLRLQVDIPEAMAATIRDKDTVSFFTSAFPGKRITGHISRRSMNINPQMRSERMEIDVLNADEMLSPGMFAEVVFQSAGNKEAFSVPKSAVVTSTERKYVLVMRDGHIKKVDVSTGSESASKIELYGLLQAGEKVILNANDEIKENN